MLSQNDATLRQFAPDLWRTHAARWAHLW